MVFMIMDIDPRDALAIQHVAFTYASANDDRDIAAIDACFTPDGSFGLRIAGQDPIGPFDPSTTPTRSDFFSADLGAQTDQRRHVVTNLRFVEVEADRVVTLSYFTLMVTDGGVTRALTTGVYRDVMVRNDGGWLIAEKWLELDGSP